MTKGFTSCLQIFPVPRPGETAGFYERLGFRAVYYLEASEPHVCLYKDAVEIVLTKSKMDEVVPNRVVHGYGYDAYLITDSQEEIEAELVRLGVKIVRPLSVTDYDNRELVFEDIDGRWIAVGKKQN
ncbi:VOC family protein [Paenibacillus chitinolyticus]|uniref:VOC family protein n=1 Tax=Paenibacillus chitinolyticus TaxID=79263 RepID=UPI003558DB12